MLMGQGMKRQETGISSFVAAGHFQSQSPNPTQILQSADFSALMGPFWSCKEGNVLL
jgi:hypothetical protein